MHLLDCVFIPRRDAQVVDLGRGSVLVDAHSGLVFELNAVAGEVWRLISEGHPARAVCDRLASRYAVDRATIEADVTALLNTLSERGLITAAPQTDAR